MHEPAGAKFLELRRRLDHRLVARPGRVAGVAELLEEHHRHVAGREIVDEVLDQVPRRDREAAGWPGWPGWPGWIEERRLDPVPDRRHRLAGALPAALGRDRRLARRRGEHAQHLGLRAR